MARDFLAAQPSSVKHETSLCKSGLVVCDEGAHLQALVCLISTVRPVSNTLGNLKISVEYAMGRVPPQSLVAVMEASCQGRWLGFFPRGFTTTTETVRMSVRGCNSQADPS